jgi:formylglycine-generating enzyme required for sulfatase activity
MPLKALCDEPKCQIQVSYGDSLNPELLDPNHPYNKSGKVYYRALDSLGNPSAWVEATYDMASDNSCGKNAYPVPVNGKTVCVDAYEYPNQKGEKPQGMVSHQKAVSLCAAAGKHLCSLEEWQAACLGKNKTRYPYGNRYLPASCATDAKEPGRSGYAEHCRSYFGQFDMSGNLWEWTASPAKEKAGNFLVAGGAWNTQNKSFCTETKFSFYPQNEYPFVGFRCCK